MARNAEPNGMASIGKQMTVGGYAAVESIAMKCIMMQWQKMCLQ